MQQIKGYETFVKIEQIDKGWSNDQKYYIETVNGTKLLLRVASISEYERKKAEYETMKQVEVLQVPTSKPIDFGICHNGESVYTLLTWCEGEDAEIVLPLLTETEQYVLGVNSGKILKQIHTIATPAEEEDWSSKFGRKTKQKVEKYLACGITFAGDDRILSYLDDKRHLLDGRPQCYQHGDYHTGNMVISANQELAVIDFNRCDYGDPWEEFNRIVWSATISPHFATGQLNGYFGGKPPIVFFELLAFYIASNTLSSIYWAPTFGEAEIERMKQQASDVLDWFDQMNNPIPTWYLQDFYIQYIDDVPYKLKAPFDLSFMQKYGTVFKVFDDQDSGNICFGVKAGQHRYFVKFAGAPTERYVGNDEDAITRLKATVPIYEELAHRHLIKLVTAEAIGGGFALVFEWVDGACMGRMYPQSRARFMRMSDDVKLQVFADILSFHDHVADQGYVAIDFYDGSIMYDFTTEQTMICDIDFYARQPYVNDMGRMWGSSRFMAPEEYQLGAAIDEITNVYLMGATAFALFSPYERTLQNWPLSKALYKVALKAVSDERSERQQSIEQFIKEWNAARQQDSPKQLPSE